LPSPKPTRTTAAGAAAHRRDSGIRGASVTAGGGRRVATTGINASMTKIAATANSVKLTGEPRLRNCCAPASANRLTAM
jgi:hypothetical protein